jgi:hypothetical protein
MLESWVPLIVRLRTAAKNVTEAKTPEAAGVAVGELALSCGQCHAALRAGPEFSTPKPPAEGEDLQARMQQHRWAADRLWEGIVQNSPDLWTRGLAGFETLPPCNDDLAGERGRPDAAEALRERLVEITHSAATAEDLERRAATYGELLGTCSTCHLSGC